MKQIVFYISFIFLFLIGCLNNPQKTSSFTVGEIATAPEAVTNNAVVVATIENTAYLFSFGGLDSTKLYSGIHKRNYRYNITKNTWLKLSNLPDTLGKIANATSLIKDTIYIMGGYHVFADGHEVSSNKVHRYAVKSNRFLTDGASIPVPIDDHIQAVWRDSLIFIVTGWSQKENVPNVQIYNPYKNTWQVGTAVPNNYKFKAFGANGIIVKDTIYYFGGAAMGKNYPVQSSLRKGVINPKNPSEITWSLTELDAAMSSYRMVATTIFDIPHFIGGSAVTYNYNGIAYNKTGGVQPNGKDFYYKNGKIYNNVNSLLPMDLRGLGSVNDTVKYLYGGMQNNQKVSNKILKLIWK